MAGERGRGWEGLERGWRGLTFDTFARGSLVLIFSSFILEMYNQEKDSGKKEIILKVFLRLMISFIILSSLYYMIPLISLGRGLLLISFFSFGLLQFLWHISYRFLKNHSFASKILILGTGQLAYKIGEVIKSMDHNYVLAGFVNLPSETVCVPTRSILMNGNGLLYTVKKEKAN
jgi:FlaA1/EpsC-like NDP-sugar epimerase